MASQNRKKLEKMLASQQRTKFVPYHQRKLSDGSNASSQEIQPGPQGQADFYRQ